MPKLHTPRDGAQILGISYASLKQWIYQSKLKSVQTPGGHHRIPESEIDRLLPRVTRTESWESGAPSVVSADAIDSSAE